MPENILVCSGHLNQKSYSKVGQVHFLMIISSDFHIIIRNGLSVDDTAGQEVQLPATKLLKHITYRAYSIPIYKLF